MEAIGLKNDAVKLQQILGSKLYSDKYSFIMETLQNSTDSMRKAGKADEFFEVGIDDYYNFYVRDYGVSFESKEDIVKYLCTLLESSKTQQKDNNELQEIGKYGIGKISSAAFNKTWNYKIYKNGKGINLQVQEIEGKGIFYDFTSDYYDTEEKDGVYYYIKINENIRVFTDNLLKKACYFQNIKFVFTPGILDTIGREKLTINEDFKIIKSKDFQYSSLSQFREFHICLDQYAYPINWAELDMDPIKLNIGLRFDLNELDINPTREVITLSADYKEKVTAKINTVIQWFADKYNLQNPVKVNSDFKTHYIALENAKLIQINLDENLCFDFTNIFKRFNVTTNIPEFEGISNTFFGFFLSFIDSKFRFIFPSHAAIKRNKVVRNPWVNKWHANNLFIADCSLSRIKQTYLKDLLDKQGLSEYYLLKDTAKYVMFHEDALLNVAVSYEHILNFDKAMYLSNEEYKKTIDKSILNFNICLERFKKSYLPKLSELQVPAEYHNITKKSKTSLELIDAHIVAKTIRRPEKYTNAGYVFTDFVLNLKDAYKIPRFHIYGVEEDKEKLVSLWKRVNTDKIKIVLLTEKNKKTVENLNLHNFINVDKVKDNLKVVSSYITAIHIEKELKKYKSICDRREVIGKFLSKSFAKDLEELMEFEDTNSFDNISRYRNQQAEDFLSELYSLFLENPNLFKSDYYEKLNKVLKDIEKYDFVELFSNKLYDYDELQDKEVANKHVKAMRDLCIYRGRKMDWQFYKPEILVNE